MKNLGLFESAALKLTGWYLAIIMVLSISMSLAIYHMSTAYFNSDADHQIGYLNDYLPTDGFKTFISLRQSDAQTDRDHLRLNLAFFNLFVLIVGGAGSYALARRTLKPIEESHESQARFASDASHELKTPLAVMQSEIEVALRDPKLAKQDATELLKSNLEEVGKLRDMSDALLKLSANGHTDWRLKIVNLKSIVDQSANELSKAAKAKKIKLVLNLNNTKVKGEPQALSQLVSILIDNGIKYSEAGSTIDLFVKRSSDLAILVVKDEGQGIAQADLPHIFDRFWRADKSRSKNSIAGYGLGLALAKQIAQMHKADIEVTSADGLGTTFTVKFPAV